MHTSARTIALVLAVATAAAFAAPAAQAHGRVGGGDIDPRALPNAVAYETYERWITVINHTTADITAVYMSEVNDDWRDALNRGVLPIGYELTIEPEEHFNSCDFDLMVEFSDGTFGYAWNFDACSMLTAEFTDETIVLTDVDGYTTEFEYDN